MSFVGNLILFPIDKLDKVIAKVRQQISTVQFYLGHSVDLTYRLVL